MPIKIEEAHLQIRFYDWIRLRALEAGTIYLNSSIGENTTEEFLSQIAELERMGHADVTIRLCSPGGGAYYAFAIYDAIREVSNSGAKVTIVVDGWAASAASMIVLQAADERVAQPNARFLLHEARRWIFWAVEKTSDLEDEVAEMKAITTQIVKVLAERCNKTPADIEELIRRKEVWMSAEEALEWGLIDRIL